VDSLFKKKQAPIDDANPTALMIVKVALIASLLCLNWIVCQRYIHRDKFIILTLLEAKESHNTHMLKTKFIAATPVKTLQGWSVIGAGCGTESRG